MTSDASDSPAPPPRRRIGLGWCAVAVGGLLAIVLVLFLGLGWAEEPRQRRWVLLDLPLKLAVGVHATGTFTPEHDGPYHLEVRFRCDRPTEEIGGAIAGDLFGHPGPPGLSIWWTVRRPGEGDVRLGTSPERLEGTIGGGEISVVIGRVIDGRAVPMEVEVRVERAPAPLAECDARLIVAASGDWVTYSWLEADVRRLLVIGVAAALLLGLGIPLALSAYRRTHGPVTGS